MALLEGRDLPHAWEGTVVVVPGDFEEQVQALVEEVEALADRALDPDQSTAAFEVSSWSAKSQNAMVQALDAAEVPHEWDSDGDLVVYESAADEVGDLLNEVAQSGVSSDDEPEEIDGLELHSILGALFDASDRLLRDPHDFKQAETVVQTAPKLANAAVPFGYEAEQWEALKLATKTLEATIQGAADGSAEYFKAEDDTDAVGDEESDSDSDGLKKSDDGEPVGESVESAAVSLRDLLRPLV